MTMMLDNLYAKTIRDERVSLPVWGIGIALLCAMMVAVYPSIGSNAEDLNTLLDSYPPAIKAFFGDFADFSKPAGFLDAELFSLMLPIFVLIYGIGRAADTIAGERERGTLEVLLTLPVSRRHVAVAKTLAVLSGLAAMAATAWLSLWLPALALGVDISGGRLLEASFMVFLFGASFAGLALAVGAWTGRRGLAIGVAAGYATVAFFVNGLSALYEPLETLLPLSAFHYYTDAVPIVNGIDWWHAAVLIGFSLVAFGVAFMGIERRDIT